MNIQDTAEKIRSTKRRIYDITNVLEGIGLIKKPQKNVVQWTQGSIYSQQQQSRLQSMSQENFRLVQELENLQKQIQRASDSLKTLRRNPRSTFVTHSDFLCILNESDTTIVIRAPKGTLLEVSDAREVHLDSHKAGPIELFICAGTHGLTRVERADPPETPAPPTPLPLSYPSSMYAYSSVPLLSEFPNSFLE